MVYLHLLLPQDDQIEQIHTLLQDNVSLMSQNHCVSISNLIDAFEPSQASTITLSGSANDDGTNLTGTASLASLK